MSRKRGRPGRQYRLRVRTARREPIDYDALARASLEHAAMNQLEEKPTHPTPQKDVRPARHRGRKKEVHHDHLA